MDGLAISFESWQKGQRQFKIEGVAPAGQGALRIKSSDGCVQIMTGGAVPQSGDCIVPVEEVRQENDTAVIASLKLKQGQYIRYQGSDCKKGALVLKQGASLLPPQIATAASMGKSKVKVSAKLKAAVVATCDELVDIDCKKVAPYQVRLSNSYALDAILRQTGLCEPSLFHLIDDKKLLLREIKKILSAFDLVVLSGGVSMGQFDYVPQVLQELGVKVLFHKVAQKPGKPFWFGQSTRGVAVFALPGNPVSTQICAYRYVIPYLHKTAGQPYNACWAVLNEEISAKTDLTYFAPVKIFSDEKGTLQATPVPIGGSGDYASLSQADGFVELEAKRQQFPRGFVAPLYFW